MATDTVLPFRTTFTAEDASPPLVRTGGEAPSSTSLDKTIDSFTPSVLTHLKEIFEKLSDDSKGEGDVAKRGMDNASAKAFLHSIQRQAQRDDKPDVYCPLLQHDIVGINEFLAYMASQEADAMAPPKARDLSQPIANYFISSSHNTYLTGNQLSSASSIEPYRNVLSRGCRCVEIDVWDGKLTPESSDCSDSENKRPRKSPKKKKSKSAANLQVSDTLDKRLNQSSYKRSPQASHSTSKGSLPVTRPETIRGQISSTASAASTSSLNRREPRVLHGPTLSKGVSFRDVCYTIRDAAFITSDLPVIISLEVHASLEQQEIMVEIMKEVWRGLLVDIQSMKKVNSSTLPSPNELRRKLLIKVKGPALDPNVSNGHTEGDEEQQNSKTSVKMPPMRKVIDVLSALAVYTKGYTFKDFLQPEASLPAHVFSLSEASVRGIHKNHGPLLFAHNRSFLMRVFPSGMRVDSSNFDPCFFWRQGIQMVVLNWQRLDKAMMLNEGMFTGEEGWALKPKWYRAAQAPVSSTSCGGASAGTVPETEDDKPNRHTLDLTLTLFAGQNIQSPACNTHVTRFKPYVTCELHVAKPNEIVDGIPEKEGKQKLGNYKRRSKASKGVDPDFGGEELQFPQVSGVIEELSFVRLKVRDKKIGRDDLAAFACIRLDRLQPGYRFIHLLDAKGLRTEGVLLVKIDKQLLQTF